MPPPKSHVPDFASHSYWQQRFAADEPPAGFEWLGLPPIFAAFIQDWASGALADEDAVDEGREPSVLSPPPPDILHIGSGSSRLSNELRRWHPSSLARILNVDFAGAAVSWGRQREIDEFGPSTAAAGSMRWATLDLLASADVVDAVGPASRRPTRPLLVIDKSTADALSCGPWRPSPFADDADRQQEPRLLHPLALLARNLALVAPEASTWLVYTYSAADRLAGIDLGGLWERTRKELVDVPELDAAGRVVVGRPCVQHAMEVWARTAAPAPAIA